MSEWLASLLDPDLSSYTAGGLYAFVWTLVFVETGILIAFWLPGDSILFAAGLVAASPGSGVSLPLLCAGTVVAAVAGDTLAYTTGRRLGRPWLERRPPTIRRHLHRAEEFYRRFGAMAIVICRFVPWARVFVPVLAGVAKMPYHRFAAANLVGALVWGAGLPVMGYFAYQVPAVRYTAYAIAGVAILSSFVVPVVARVRAQRAKRAEGAAQGPASDPARRPAADEAA